MSWVFDLGLNPNLNIYIYKHKYTHRHKKQDSDFISMLCAVLNKSLKQHLTKLKLYVHLPPITTVFTDQQKTYIDQFCADIRCLLEDLQSAAADKDGRPEREREREPKESVLSACLDYDDYDDDPDVMFYLYFNLQVTCLL